MRELPHREYAPDGILVASAKCQPLRRKAFKGAFSHFAKNRFQRKEVVMYRGVLIAASIAALCCMLAASRVSQAMEPTPEQAGKDTGIAPLLLTPPFDPWTAPKLFVDPPWPDCRLCRCRLDKKCLCNCHELLRPCPHCHSLVARNPLILLTP